MRIRFCDQFSKPCSLSWRTTGMRNFRTTHHLVRNSHFLFKSHFLLFNSKLLLLQFSQHLSFDQPFPSLSSSHSSSLILNTTMAAHPHSHGLHYSQQSTPSIFSSFSFFHHQKTLQFFTQHSKSIPKPIPTLILPNQNLKLRIQATVSS